MPLFRSLFDFQQGAHSACISQTGKTNSSSSHPHVWIFLGWLTEHWWNVSTTVTICDKTVISCSAQEMKVTAAGSFNVRARLFAGQDEAVQISDDLHMNSTSWMRLHQAVITKARD